MMIIDRSTFMTMFAAGAPDGWTLSWRSGAWAIHDETGKIRGFIAPILSPTEVIAHAWHYFESTDPRMVDIRQRYAQQIEDATKRFEWAKAAANQWYNDEVTRRQLDIAEERVKRAESKTVDLTMSGG